MQGTVTRSTGSWYDVRCDDGKLLECRIRGKFRLEGFELTNPVAVGDQVVLEKEDSGTAMITKILPRKNYIIRSSPKRKTMNHIVAANLDQVMVMATLREPRTSTGFIDRYLLTAAVYDIRAAVLFNKADLYQKKEMAAFETLSTLYHSLGYPCYLISAVTEEGIEAAKKLLKDKTSLISGHSGVGKSTLINALHPEYDLKTAEISAFSGKGQHATTFAEMFELPFGGYIIDTPGIKEFGIVDLELAEVSGYFPEMKDLMHDCKFHDCQHVNEPKCAVRGAYENGEIAESRYKCYLSILEDLRSKKGIY